MPRGRVTRSATSSVAASTPSAAATPFQLSTAKLKYLKKPRSERFEVTESSTAKRSRRLRGPPGGSNAIGARLHGVVRTIMSPAIQSIDVENSSRTKKAGLAQP